MDKKVQNLKINIYYKKWKIKQTRRTKRTITRLRCKDIKTSEEEVSLTFNFFRERNCRADH